MNPYRAALLAFLATLAAAFGQATQPKTFNFDSDAAGTAPAGFTSCATGGGMPGTLCWSLTAANTPTWTSA